MNLLVAKQIVNTLTQCPFVLKVQNRLTTRVFTVNMLFILDLMIIMS